jgi:hypothetical protein
MDNEDCKIVVEHTKRYCYIREGWDSFGRKGQYYGKICIYGMWWAIVLWDDEEDPAFFKVDGLKITGVVEPSEVK